MRINFRRWGVFNVVGVGGFVVQLGAIALLTRYFGWAPFAATAVGLELAAVQNFVAHSRWTWADRRVTGWRAWVHRYAQYQAAKTTALLANLAITTLITHAGAPPEIANTAAVLACAIPNYLVSERLVFRHGVISSRRLEDYEFSPRSSATVD